MTVPDLTETYNHAKELTLNALIQDGLLTKEESETWAERHAIVIVKNSWLGQLWVKFHGKDDEDSSYRIHVVETTKGKQKDESKDREGKPETGSLARFTTDEKS